MTAGEASLAARDKTKSSDVAALARESKTELAASDEAAAAAKSLSKSDSGYSEHSEEQQQHQQPPAAATAAVTEEDDEEAEEPKIKKELSVEAAHERFSRRYANQNFRELTPSSEDDDDDNDDDSVDGRGDSWRDYGARASQSVC